jgi:hypothetical protein
MEFIAVHPYEYTKSQVCKEASPGERANRHAFERLVKSGQLVVAKIGRLEGNRTVLRDLVGPPDIDPARVEQQRSAPIGNDLPTNVGEHGAGNSPKAAVSTPSEPQLDTNLGRAANVDNPGTPTLSEATMVPADVPDQGSRNTVQTTDVDDLGDSDISPQCIRCGESHPPTPPGHMNWACYVTETQRDLGRQEDSA